ncbi:MAG: protein kinase [Myxococcota bacterium]
MRGPVPFGRHLLLERIAVGGMAEVFRAKSFGVEGFERFVAVKRILASMAEDQDFIRMFIDEARIASHLSHQNIIQIYELGKHEGLYFISMEYVGGRDLRALLDRQKKLREPLDPAMACFIISKVAEALDYAHRKRDPAGKELKIIHRDVSPQNVILSFEGEVKLCDFGIAKAVTQSTRTQVGVLKGKFAYMSPEQVRGRPIDRRSDIFALGNVFYEMLTGERLFLAETDYSTLEAVRSARVPPPRTFTPDLPPRLEEIVMKMLTREPDQRYQWASQVLEDLYKFLVGSGQVYHPHHLRQFMQDAYASDIEEENLKLESFQSLRLGAETKDARPLAEKSTSEILRGLGLAPEDEPPPSDDDTHEQVMAPSLGASMSSVDEVPLVAPASSDRHVLHGDRVVEHDDMAATLLGDEGSVSDATVGDGAEAALRREIQATQAAMAAAFSEGPVQAVSSDFDDGAKTTLDDPAEGPLLSAEVRRTANRGFDEPQDTALSPAPPMMPPAASGALRKSSFPPTVVRPPSRQEEPRRTPALLGPNRNPIEKADTGGALNSARAVIERNGPMSAAPARPPTAQNVHLVLPLPGPDPSPAPTAPLPRPTPPPPAQTAKGAPPAKPAPSRDPRTVLAAAATMVLALIVLFFVIALSQRPSGATLHVDTLPTSDVEILLDGTLVSASAPVELSGLSLGEHTIEVRAKGYLTYRQAFPLNEPRPHTLTIPLTQSNEGDNHGR